MNNRLFVVSVIGILLGTPLAVASTTIPSTSAVTSAKTAIATHAQIVKQKRIAHIQARIMRLKRLDTILTSKSETLRLAKAARVKSQIRKLQAHLTKLQGK
ncbi:hypothetical protein F6A13_11105 [Acidithiobacillus sp. 'AMD consortium']|jgi:hypothetical protein|uniref:Uncharacterized protein n=2 Tax=Acidithiobacillus ferrooxidans TaxID=920 RepID=B7J727_ACIF2|nr:MULTISPECIES: hypothetical protein [Acidithiobacillus]EGQ61318.1 hypothetical protein GGI1_05885 [Acidithiobacillus sp. GGI-221]MCL5956367.1 hypothetical protein [Gammaproteobacteria bacterium]MDA8115014.1 hypothetical protein [Acidithiobacillus sp.]ACH84322.1 hypothetical protein Lferr_2116 [Acidithiobacillus ferrooxidans ATCC 53993]ACK80808.1 hypothetical protein AFE_2492 [Acidithiobacillus ferrooxidans ATCC 23270]